MGEIQSNQTKWMVAVGSIIPSRGNCEGRLRLLCTKAGESFTSFRSSSFLILVCNSRIFRIPLDVDNNEKDRTVALIRYPAIGRACLRSTKSGVDRTM